SGARRPAYGVQAHRILGVHGYASRQVQARRNVGIGKSPLGLLGGSRMQVLVTGHLGYIGTVLTPMLAEAGHRVVGSDSDLYRQSTFSAGGILPEVPNIGKDVRDLEVEDVLGYDAVLHLAGLSNDPLGFLNPETTFDINHRASVRLAE